MTRHGWSRRDFLRAGGAAAAMASIGGCRPDGAVAPSGTETTLDLSALRPPAGVTPAALASDRAYWTKVAGQYDVLDDVIQLENGYWGIMARPVLSRYERLTETVNRRNSYYARRKFEGDEAAARQRTAGALGVDADEIAFTRNATEALQALIGGYNRLRPGDAVLYSDLDYDSMQMAMDWLHFRRGVDVVTVAIPEPASRQKVVDAYAAALEAHPRVRLVLLTHLSHRTGLVLPIAEISDLARHHGADVIVDAAHSFGQMDFSVKDLGADFIGFNLHKWIGAPLGVGVMYVAKSRVTDVDRYMADLDRPDDRVTSRVHTGTVNFASVLAVPDALDFHEAVGAAYKEARLKRLRALWAEELRGRPGIEILTPDDPSMHAGITSFRLAGRTSAQDNIELSRRLLEEFNIFTVHRTGVAKGACVRVTPSVFTSEDDVTALREALVKMTAA